MQPPSVISRRLLLLAPSVLLLFLVRAHTFSEPLEADETLYMLMAQDWRQGGRPYESIWDNKPIGTFLLYRAAIAICGYHEMTPKLISLAANLLSLLLLCALLGNGRRESWQLGLWLLAWALMSGLYRCHANGSNMEVPLLPVLLAGCLLLDRYQRLDDERCWWGAVAVFIGSTLLKPVSLPFVAVPLLLRPAAEWRAVRPLVWRAVAAAVALPLVHLLVYGLCGYPPQLLLELATTNAGYVAGDQQHDWLGIVRSLVTFPFVDALRLICPLVLLAYVGAAAALWPRPRPRDLAIVLYLIMALLAVALPGRQSPHYYILLLPFILLALSAAAARLPSRYARLAPVGVFLYLAIVVGATYFTRDSAAISEEKYGTWFLRDRYIGEQLAGLGVTGRRVYVDGSHPGILFYSGNFPATRFAAAWYVALGQITMPELLELTQASSPDACVMLNPLASQLYSDGFRHWLTTTYAELPQLAGARVFVTPELLREALQRQDE